MNNLFYNFKLNECESVDSKVFGNKARFINHNHKKPNVSAEIVNMGEEDLVSFWALKDIYIHE